MSYIWKKTVLTYDDDSVVESEPELEITSKGETGSSAYEVAVSNGFKGTEEEWVESLKGSNGDPGADAIAMSISSSNGTVFKNTSDSTILTAHVYIGGIECSIDDAGMVTDNSESLGLVKWYKGSALIGTTGSLTVSASEVSSVAVYSCQLEV